jgi:hypothetical protein
MWAVLYLDFRLYSSVCRSKHLFDDYLYIVYVNILVIDVFIQIYTKNTILVHNYSLMHLKLLVYCVPFCAMCRFVPYAVLCRVPFWADAVWSSCHFVPCAVCACAVMFCAVLIVNRLDCLDKKKFFGSLLCRYVFIRLVSFVNLKYSTFKYILNLESKNIHCLYTLYTEIGSVQYD